MLGKKRAAAHTHIFIKVTYLVTRSIKRGICFVNCVAVMHLVPCNSGGESDDTGMRVEAPREEFHLLPVPSVRFRPLCGRGPATHVEHISPLLFLLSAHMAA